MPRSLFRLHAAAASLFDLMGGLELVQIWLRLVTHTQPLAPDERMAVSTVLGEQGVDYELVRIAEGGWLRLAFRYNGRRAFAIGHTVFLPPNGRADRSLLLHELVHTAQYEHLGSRYIGEALYAQWRLAARCYDYGGDKGLLAAVRDGRGYALFNREAQAQIAQDYFRRRQRGKEVTAFLPFVDALRRGDF